MLASLVSEAVGQLRFRAIEYLYDTGPAVFTVLVSTPGRPTQWDDREAVLFLARSEDPPVCTVYVPPQVPPTRDPRLPQPTPIAIWDGDHGAATASLEERICAADTIVLASLVSAAVGELRFRAIEYLHDTGPAVFTVLASTPDRPTQWDDREAVLFLARSEDGGAEFKFADTTKWNYLGTRTNIAWVYGGEGIEGYDSCLRSSLAEIRFIRDREAYGNPWVRTTSKRIPSGQGAGVVLYERPSSYGDQVYQRVWLTGRDANLFDAQIVDDDDDPANGFKYTITTARPLPDGRYRFLEHEQSGGEMPCNYIRPGFEWVVTVGGALPTLAPEPTPDRSR